MDKKPTAKIAVSSSTKNDDGSSGSGGKQKKKKGKNGSSAARPGTKVKKILLHARILVYNGRLITATWRESRLLEISLWHV